MGIAERIRAANALDAKTAAESAVLAGAKASPRAARKWGNPTRPDDRKPDVVRPAAGRGGCEDAPPADGQHRAVLAAGLATFGNGSAAGGAGANPAVEVAARRRVAGGGRAAALAKLGGAASWCTTSHGSVSAHVKPFNKFNQASGGRYEEAGEATTGSGADMGRWNSSG